jgi:hypothetical protein
MPSRNPQFVVYVSGSPLKFVVNTNIYIFVGIILAVYYKYILFFLWSAGCYTPSRTQTRIRTNCHLGNPDQNQDRAQDTLGALEFSPRSILDSHAMVA